MSTLTLTVLRCPESVALQQRQAQGGQITLGRGAECDWRLDADKGISKMHCALEFLAGEWQVRDLSTNGTFVNHADAPVGRDQVRPLNDGDRLQLGAYEIEVRITPDESTSEGTPGARADSPMTRSAAAAPAIKIPVEWSMEGPSGKRATVPGLDAPSTDRALHRPIVRDAAGSVAEAFPRAIDRPQAPLTIPADWYVRELGSDAATPPAPAAVPLPAHAGMGLAAEPSTPAPRSPEPALTP